MSDLQWWYLDAAPLNERASSQLPAYPQSSAAREQDFVWTLVLLGQSEVICMAEVTTSQAA